MKRYIFLFVFAVAVGSFAKAQDQYDFFLKPDEMTTQEVIFKGPFASDEIRLMLGVKWFEIESRLELVFDRKSINDNSDRLLLFPFFEHAYHFKDLLDCKSHKKMLWTKMKGNENSFMSYFLESDNLHITDYRNCYKTLAKNNEEEFYFDLPVIEKEFTINLNGLFVIRNQKKPWFSFSSKDKKIEFKVKPITLHITLDLPPEAAPVCEISAKVVPYVKAVQEIMLKDREELLAAQKNQSCTYFNLMKNHIRRRFVETNSMCEKYMFCEEIAAAVKEYSDLCLAVFDLECKPAVTATATCSLSENELSSINSRLKTLQMRINIKKKDGGSTAEEMKEYQSIISAVNPKITPECRRTYKNLIEAYTNYCTVIEGLF